MTSVIFASHSLVIYFYFPMFFNFVFAACHTRVSYFLAHYFKGFKGLVILKNMYKEI